MSKINQIIKKISNKIFKTAKRYWRLIGIGLIIAALIGFWFYRRLKTNQVQATYISPEIRNLKKTLSVSGVIAAKEHVKLRFSNGGKLIWLGAKEGDQVKKYQAIASIDKRSAQKTLQKKLNSYLKERWDWEQTLDDTQDRWLPKSEARDKDKSQWDLSNSVLDVEIQDIAIQDTVLTSPIDGILIKSPSLVSGVQLLYTDIFEIVNPDSLIFRAAVDETDIGLVTLGQSGTISLDTYPQEKINSAVSYIDFLSSSSDTGTVFIVELPLHQTNALEKYRLGMNGDVQIQLEQRDQVLAIPIDATIERDNQIWVTVKNDQGQDEDRKIQIGLETDEYFEVLEGLSPNDQVLLPSNQ